MLLELTIRAISPSLPSSEGPEMSLVLSPCSYLYNKCLHRSPHVEVSRVKRYWWVQQRSVTERAREEGERGQARIRSYPILHNIYILVLEPPPPDSAFPEDCDEDPDAGGGDSGTESEADRGSGPTPLI